MVHLRYICGLWYINVYYDGLSQQLTISHQTPGWKSLEALLDGKPWLCPQIWGGPADCQSNFYKVLTAGLFLFSSQTKKSWLLTASISNFASPKTPTWAWLVTPPTPRHPQRKGSRPDARLWWHPGGGAMLKSSCLFSDICQPLNYSKKMDILYIYIGIYWNICSSLNRFLEIHLTWNFMEFSQKYIIFK